MKKYIVLLISIFSILLFSGCRDDYHASEEFQTARYDIEEVSKISVKDICLKQNNSYFGPNVYIFDSEEKYVSVSASVDVINKINVKKEADELNIYANKYTNYVTETVDIYVYGYTFKDLSFSNSKVNIKKDTLDNEYINMKLYGATRANIEEINCNELKAEISGASNATINKLTLDKADINISGASRFEVLNSTIRNLNMNLSGASNSSLNESIIKAFHLYLSGASSLKGIGNNEYLDVILSGASTLDLLDMQVITIDKADISGASTMKVDFVNKMIANLSGASELDYRSKNGILDIEKSTSCIVNKLNN